jgi:hypothetical protein
VVRLRARSTALVVIASAACAFGPVIAVCFQPAVAAAAVAKKCSMAKAGGHSYTVSATNVSCTFADKWVSIMAAKRLKLYAIEVPLSGSPAGYSCRGGTKFRGVSMPDVKGNVQVSGNCAKGIGLGNSPYFNWVVVSKY